MDPDPVCPERLDPDLVWPEGWIRIRICFLLRGWIRIWCVLRGWIRIQFVLRGWNRIRLIQDRIRNPGGSLTPKFIILVLFFHFECVCSKLTS